MAAERFGGCGLRAVEPGRGWTTTRVQEAAETAGRWETGMSIAATCSGYFNFVWRTVAV